MHKGLSVLCCWGGVGGQTKGAKAWFFHGVM